MQRMFQGVHEKIYVGITYWNSPWRNKKIWVWKCSKSFGYKDVLKRHVKVVHEKKKDFQCDRCFQQFGLNTSKFNFQMIWIVEICTIYIHTCIHTYSDIYKKPFNLDVNIYLRKIILVYAYHLNFLIRCCYKPPKNQP